MTTPTKRSAKARKPSLKPKKITNTSWWYEDEGGIWIINQVFTSGVYLRTDSTRLTWGPLMKAASRCLTPAKKTKAL